MTASEVWSVEAPAKVNLFLRIGRRRPDGFHELVSLFQALDLADRLRVRVASGAGCEVTIEVDGPDLGPERDNLAVRAARAFGDAFPLPGPVHVALEKRIPAGAGLGGGSSDAAAVLRILSRVVEDLGGSVDGSELRRVAAGLGSDVPFFLEPSPLALGRGRGEVLTPLEPLPPRPVVVALPPVHVATAWAYRTLAAARDRSGTAAAVAAPPLGERPAWEEVIGAMANDFESVVPAAHDEVAASLDGLRGAGARGVLLSGSGGASFGLFDEPEEAERAARDLGERLGWPFLATRTRATMPEPRAG